MIRKLDEHVINKIAAGEVIERPASVIKELVENAIDAGAKNITVEVKEGGKKLIRVTDDGVGIKSEEVASAVLRHTTSKILDEKDLLTIRTLGFRGEALASIVAVSNFELTTKTKGEITGTYYNNMAKSGQEISKVGAMDGTTIVVKNIFYNTPVRLKFLKSTGTELSYITELIGHMALSNPHIAFKFISSNDIKLVTRGNGKLYDVLFEMYGKSICKELLKVDYEADHITVRGFIGKPALTRGNKVYEIFFLNHRYIKSKIIEKGLENGFSGRLMQHRHPFAVLHIEIDSAKVDVNVHPNKLEVRFDDDDFIFNHISKAVKSTLDGKEYVVDVKNSDDEEKKEILNQPEEEIQNTNELNEYTGSDVADDLVQELNEDEEYDYGLFEEEIDLLKEEIAFLENNEMVVEEKPEIEFEADSITGEQQSFLTKEDVKNHKIIGQLFDTYWIVEYNDKMYMIDQHAAHEKVLYEKLIKSYKDKQIYAQTLLMPKVIKLNALAADYLEQHLEDFNVLGFDIEKFGDVDYIIRAVPYIFGEALDGGDFVQLLDELMGYSKASSFEVFSHDLATMACKAAIKANDKQSVAEYKTLIDELLTLDNPYHCPHGRPTMIVMSKKEIEKDFKRIV